VDNTVLALEWDLNVKVDLLKNRAVSQLTGVSISYKFTTSSSPFALDNIFLNLIFENVLVNLKYHIFLVNI
jgi:hypothetical protein